MTLASAAPHSPALLSSLLRLESQFAMGAVVNVLLQLAVSMRAHGRGGMLLVVPSGTEDWKESMLQPLTYLITPPFSGLGELMRKGKDKVSSMTNWENAMARAVGVGPVTDEVCRDYIVHIEALTLAGMLKPSASSKAKAKN